MSKGKKFDLAFVNFNVAAHQQAIADVQATQGQAQLPELKAHLDKMLPTLQTHLERAQALQQKLSGGSPTP
jgi:predicted outer membrane protein